MMKIKETLVCWPTNEFELSHPESIKKTKLIGELQGVYQHDIPQSMLGDIAYVVKLDEPTKEAVEGTLQFGVSYLYPYQVEGEFSCTKGHFHANLDYDEYYFGYAGEGYLLYWDGADEWFAEKVFPGSIHHIDGKYAHRLINTSTTETLKVGACWNVLAGYDYGSIEETGFPVRCFLENGSIVWKEQHINKKR